MECDYLFTLFKTAETDKVPVEVPKEECAAPEEPKEVKKDDVKPVEEGLEKLTVEDSKQVAVEEKTKGTEER